MKKCVFAGTFDPPTVGHADVIEKCLKIFDHVVAAILINPQKHSMLSVEQRLSLLRKLYGDNKNVTVRTFSGTAADLLMEENTPFYVRGVRDGIDFEYENRNHFASRRLMPELITIYLPCEQKHMHVSSTLVRNSILFKKDYADLVPSAILSDIQNMLEDKDV